jgi:hypothetical protein
MRTLTLICCFVICTAFARASVVLSHFEFEARNNRVDFTWGTSSEINNYFFQFVRNGIPLYQITGHGTTTQPYEYAWTDTGAVDNTTCHYLFRCGGGSSQDSLLSFTVIPPHWVALGSISAQGDANGVQLSWMTWSEVHSARLEIVRNGTTVGSVPGHEISTNPHTYFWLDSTVSAGAAYSYTLWAIKDDSTRDSLGTTSITLDARNPFDLRPSSFALSAYPNPFNPATTLTFTLPVSQKVRITIYDIMGREQQRLADGILAAGEHRLTFDASALPSGIYFARLTGTHVIATRKLLLLK